MKLIERPVHSIVSAVADAAARWCDGDFPPRVRAVGAICARTGYSVPVVDFGLDRLFASLTRPAIEATIVDELGSLRVLDEFDERPGRPRVRALPVGRVCIISSRTTIGVGIVPAIFALCAKCDVLVKDREDALVGAFFATLGQELDELRAAAVAESWSGRRDARDLTGFDAVVAFGDDATLAEIRRQLPIGTRMIPFSARASCGYVGREALVDLVAAQPVADGAARDVLLYDGEGCLSLHVLFVERGGGVSPPDFVELLARAVDRASVEFPIGTRDASRAVQVAAARDLAAFRAAGGTGAVYSDSRASYVAVLDPPQSQPPLFLPRALGVYAVGAPADAAAYLQRHRLPIEAFAVAGPRADVTDMVLHVGAARIAAFGELQSPPLGARHGGRPRIAEFVRWIGDET